jgi:translation initiation factor IF-2
MRPASRSRAAGPSIPVVVLGLSGAPNAGDELLVVESERKAREVAMHRQSKSRDVKLAQKSANMQDVFSTMGESKPNLVQLWSRRTCRAASSALRDSLNGLSTGEVAVNVVASGVGGLTESDVTLAAASKARIIAFNVRGDAAARAAIKEHGVDVRYYSIIYEAIDDIRAVLTGMLAPEVKEQIVGLAEVAACSARASSARWPAAWSSTAMCAATSRSACCATTWSFSRARSSP